jgi:two-component system response regulator YesN
MGDYMYKLLIVDDEPLVRRGIKSLVDFDTLNIGEIEEAVNGEDALNKFLKNPPDIVLADINMPKMDGLSFSEKAKKAKPSVKIALITGYDYFDYALQAIKIGVDDYILKPVSKSDVHEVLQKLIDKIKDSGTQKEIQKTLNTLLNEDQLGTEDTYKEVIQEILDKEISNSEFSLKMLSDSLGYSSGYLSGLFKKLYGTTFKEYLIKQRMEKAKLMLLTTDLKNYEIAESIGINDVNYFSARFKKVVGESPKQYKERVRKADDK